MGVLAVGVIALVMFYNSFSNNKHHSTFMLENRIPPVMIVITFTTIAYQSQNSTTTQLTLSQLLYEQKGVSVTRSESYLTWI